MNWKQWISVIVMCAGLLLLTGANFIVYPPGQEDIAAYDVKDAPMPVEEKHSETKSLTSIQEEYLHGHQSLERSYFNLITLHKIHEAEKLPFVSLEKRYQPPRA